MIGPQDALAAHWTGRLPDWARPYAQLSRLDRPIGWRLLLLPCLMGIAVARMEGGFWEEDAFLAVLFLVGAIAMRGAGCTWNDVLDRKIDAQVARTRLRPIPSGAVSVRAALVWLGAQLGVGLMVLLLLQPEAQVVALLAVPLVAAYPLMKRITWWPQAWLGVVFSWGVLVAGASYGRVLAPEILLLFAGCAAWTIGYDTVYALQDREDDALVGVRSTARLFADRWRPWTIGFYAAAVFCWSAAAIAAGMTPWLIPAFCAVGWLAARLLARVDEADPATALAAFRDNASLGLLALFAFAAQPFWLTMRAL